MSTKADTHSPPVVAVATAAAAENREVNTSEADPVVAEHHTRRFFPLFKRRQAKATEAAAEADSEAEVDADGKPKKAKKFRFFKLQRKPKADKPEQNPATYPSAAAPFIGLPGDEVKDICLEYYGGILRGVARPVREVVEAQLHYESTSQKIDSGELKQRKKAMKMEEKSFAVLKKQHAKAVAAEAKRQEKAKKKLEAAAAAAAAENETAAEKLEKEVKEKKPKPTRQSVIVFVETPERHYPLCRVAALDEELPSIEQCEAEAAAAKALEEEEAAAAAALAAANAAVPAASPVPAAAAAAVPTKSPAKPVVVAVATPAASREASPAASAAAANIAAASAASAARNASPSQ